MNTDDGTTPRKAEVDEFAADTSLSAVPTAKAAPPVGDTPPHIEPRNNLAADDKLCSTFWNWAKRHYDRYIGQPERKKFCDTDGTMDVADRMTRVALRRKESSDQHQDTLSNVASVCYYDLTSTVAAAENAMYFDGKNLPAEYEPEINTTAYTREQGRIIADHQNMLEQYTWDEDGRTEKVKEIVAWLNKYANVAASIEWARCVEKRRERVPGYYDDDGNPVEMDASGEAQPPPGTAFDAAGNPVTRLFDEDGTPQSFVFLEKEHVVKDCPHLRVHDLKDCFFDANVDDLRKKQRCFVVRWQESWEELAAQQRAGLIKNLDKLNAAHLYAGDDDDVSADRKTNADEDTTTDKTGLFYVWMVVGYAPISENTGRRGQKTGNGKWSRDNEPCLYRGKFAAAQMGDSKAVCLSLERNPYNHGETGFVLLHSHRDDKGAYHMGWPTILEPLYWQDTTNINQAFQSVNERVEAPWSSDGAISTRRIGGRRNMLVKRARGSTLEVLDPPDTTSITMPMHERIRNEMMRVTKANMAVQGEAAFSRMSATQSKLNLDQATLPMDDKADYQAESMFGWMLHMDAENWRQFGDPNTTVAVTGHNGIQRINPGQLWGPIRTKVTAVRRFKNNTLRRQELNQLLSNVMPTAIPHMARKEIRAVYRLALGEFGYDNIGNAAFPDTGDYDAEARAYNEVHLMLNVGQWVDPLPDEDQAAHLAVLEPAARMFALLPDTDKDPERLAMIRSHIEMRKSFMAQAQQTRALPGGPGGGVPQTPATLDGQVVGDRIEAEEGAIGGG